MSNVQVNKRPAEISPPEYFSTLKPGCKSFEQSIKIQPLVSAFTATPNSTFRVTVDMPNVNFRLNEVFLEAQVIVTFSSNSGSDTYGTVQPAIVPWATSLINEAKFYSGASLISDIRSLNVAYNWQQNLISNSITRNAQTYNNPTPVVYASAAAQTFRFPLTHFGNDLWSLDNGIMPLQFMKKSYFEFYWEIPAYCIYAAGTIVGTTFSFGYSVSNFNLQIVQIQDPMLDMMISTRGLIINYQEWYNYQQPLTLTASQVITIPVAYSSLRGIVWGVRRVADLTSNTLSTKQSLMSSELTDIVKLDLRINSQRRQQDNFVGVEEAIPETRRLIPMAQFSDFYNTLALNQTTHQLLGMLVGQCYCPSVISGLNTQRVQSQAYLEITWTSALSTASVIDIWLLHDRALTVQGGSLYIDE